MISIPIEKTRKWLGALTILSSIPYLAIAVYCFVALYIAYGIQKEHCPMGFLILPPLAWPSLFIFWGKGYTGLKFLKKKFGIKKLIKYITYFFVIEILISLFWYISKIGINKMFLIPAVLSCFMYIYCLSSSISLRSRLNLAEESNSFYLGIDLIKATDIFLGVVFAILFIPQLVDFKTIWIKNFPLDANIFNVGKQIGGTSLIFIYLWSAFNIKKFIPLARKAQLAASTLSIVDILAGNLFFSFLPFHVFSIIYLNVHRIKGIFYKKEQVNQKALIEKATLPVLNLALLIVIIFWLSHYSWQLGLTRFGSDWQNEYYNSAKSTDLSTLSDHMADNILKATDLYSEGKYKESLVILNEVASKSKLAPFYEMILASCYGHLGDIIKAKDIGDKAAKSLSENNASNHYNLACYYSIINEKGKSIQHLKRSIELDKSYIGQAKEDNDFKNMRDTQEFKAVVEQHVRDSGVSLPNR